jgi:hypothetical protein
LLDFAVLFRMFRQQMGVCCLFIGDRRRWMLPDQVAVSRARTGAGRALSKLAGRRVLAFQISIATTSSVAASWSIRPQATSSLTTLSELPVGSQAMSASLS